MRCGGTAWPTDSNPAAWPACWLSSRDSGEAKSGDIGILWLEFGATVLDTGGEHRLLSAIPATLNRAGQVTISGAAADQRRETFVAKSGDFVTFLTIFQLAARIAKKGRFGRPAAFSSTPAPTKSICISSSSCASVSWMFPPRRRSSWCVALHLLSGTVATTAALCSSMLIQVVHCHPLVESYYHALFRTIVETLKQNGHEVVSTDLYREGFQPAMTER
ncbi:MAG TPA: hypothetical protein VK777_33015, partial [Reyranella sp.]|nr:hypothetical protein [Reyranella sp.]